ncbi:MAG: ATP-binding cassette domain-containing protein [Clostridia bacterium]|nr:ATP-binding cassette domain-containing protein [Clostridia bacterium]
METFRIKNLTFTYPEKSRPALCDVNLDINIGEMVVLCGQSGSGKTTLLRNMKPLIAPHGKLEGLIEFYGTDVNELSQEVQASRIGYVLQNPDAQIVTDKVWHELAFGLESLGMDTKTIRLRVAEMASFFGIQGWFHKDVNELSGGQKQLLNLASVMAMQPDVLILDEPTSQLDPIAAGDFLTTVGKINRELGTTVIITEHRLEDVLPMADRAVVMDGGRIIADDTPANVGAILAKKKHPMFMAMPSPLQAYAILFNEGMGKELECPVDVRTGRNWLTKLMAGRTPSVTELKADEESLPKDPETGKTPEPSIEMKDVWFRYSRNDSDVIKDLSLSVYPGEIFCIVGGNGTGKTTAMSLAAGLRKAYRGRVKVKGRTAMLPQNPQILFTEDTVREELKDGMGTMATSDFLDVERLMDSHPYDLSGGEQQRVALAKILQTEPDILLLDEPTKGLDNELKQKLAGILDELKKEGVTILMVSHDVEFCGRYGDRCAMFFDGKIITTNAPRTFFSGNSFYTTAVNRMSRHIFGNAVNVDDLVELIRANE